MLTKGGLSVRCIKTFIVVIVVCLLLSSCEVEREYFGFRASVFTIVDKKDTHGFFGDGSFYLILDCSEKAEQAKQLVKDWKPFPLTENLQLIMYDSSKDGVHYSYNLSEEAHWPTIHNGVYKFVDRYKGAIDPSDDTDLFSRYSFNFSIASYDLDTNTLYYFEFDT